MTPLSVHREDFRCTELKNAVLKPRSEGPDRLSGQQQTPVPIVQNKDERAAFDEVFAALRAYRGIKNFGAVNARAWSLTIVRNTAYSWLMKNRPKTVVFTNDLSATEQQELEHEGPQGAKVETPEEIVLFKADAEKIQKALAQLQPQFREVIVLREINQMNYRDIAEITNVPIGTVMSRLSRGRQLLIALLGDRK
jgi:RNA polymerase sigma factor (sigma-70 family)